MVKIFEQCIKENKLRFVKVFVGMIDMRSFLTVARLKRLYELIKVAPHNVSLHSTSDSLENCHLSVKKLPKT